MQYIAPWRWAVVLAFIGVMAAALIWLWWPRGAPADVSASPTATPAVTVSPSVEPTPVSTEPTDPEPSDPPPTSPEAGDPPATPSPSPTDDLGEDVEAELELLRAGWQYEAFADYMRAQQVARPDLAWDNFGYWVTDENGEAVSLEPWLNKAELWDSIAPSIRDELLLLGPEFTRAIYRNPMWPIVTPRWNNIKTEGRGDLVDFSAVYTNADARPVLRLWPMLVTTASGVGRVEARMEPFDVDPWDFEDVEALESFIDERIWPWVQRQAPNVPQ